MIVFITNVTKFSSKDFGLRKCNFYKGDLVEIWSQSEVEGSKPVLFLEDKIHPGAVYRLISGTISVDNGTIGFLLEDYESEQDGVIEVLICGTIYLTLTSQLKKAYPPIY